MGCRLEIEFMPPPLGVWNLNHWTTREVLLLSFKATCDEI